MVSSGPEVIPIPLSGVNGEVCAVDASIAVRGGELGSWSLPVLLSGVNGEVCTEILQLLAQGGPR